MKMLKKETQDVNSLEFEGQKEEKLWFLECLLHPGSFYIISFNTHVNPVSNSRIPIFTLSTEKISYSETFYFYSKSHILWAMGFQSPSQTGGSGEVPAGWWYQVCVGGARARSPFLQQHHSIRWVSQSRENVVQKPKPSTTRKYYKSQMVSLSRSQVARAKRG